MLAVLLAAPFLSRVLLLDDTGSSWAVQDLRGFVSDLGIALLALPVALLLRRLSPWLGVLLMLAWNLWHWSNFEVVSDLGSLASVLDVGFLTDKDFLVGSAMAISRPVALALLCVLTVTAVWRWKGGVSIRVVAMCLVLGTGVLWVQSLWPLSQEVAEWRQDDFIRANFAYLFRSSGEPLDHPSDPRVAMLEVLPEIAANLDGEPLLPLPGVANNVLMVILEGVSGSFVPSLAADHGIHDQFEMPSLEGVAVSALSYSSFVSQNRKTNRGVFALLCGEPPNLVPGSPKMTQVAMVGGRVCLPQLLQRAGYRTVFLQAAPLAFMIKDQFAAKAGYDQAYGRTHFDTARAAAHNKWGIDDLSLFEQSLEIIEQLRQNPQPWFASILTVGTHHPFVFPEDHQDGEGGDQDRRQAAFDYADRALGWLVEELEGRGILDDTLVLITSDESRGLMAAVKTSGRSPKAVSRRLSQNWGVLVAIQPEGRVERIREPFAQMDLALSVLDYLGLAEGGGGLFGRSVFRRYESPRLVPFANTNQLRAGGLDTAGALFDCRVDTQECWKWTIEHGAFFGFRRTEVEWDERNDGWVLEFARRSQSEGVATSGEYEVDLLSRDRVRVRADQLVHGGPFITLMPGQWLEVDIKVEASGASGDVTFRHKVMEPSEWGFKTIDRKDTVRYHQGFVLVDGDRLRLNYTVVPEDLGRLDGFKVESNATASEGAVLDLLFHSAVLRVRTGDPPTEPGFSILQQELSRSSRP